MTQTAISQPSAAMLKPPAVLLMGETGAGKTYAARTLVEAGLEVFVLFTEPSMEVLADLPADRLHWAYIPPANPDWATLLDGAKKVNTLTYEAISRLPGINKTKYAQFLEVYARLADFKCDRTGETYGPVDAFGPNRALIIDSLSGLNIMALDLVVGSNPVRTQGEWGVAMDNLERLINKCTTGLHCPFVLTAHLEREVDEVAGGTRVMAAALGRKLAPRLPRFFSDVILAKRDGANFYWSTTAANTALKARNVGLGDKLPPTFKPLIENWRKRAGGLPTTEPRE